MASSFTFNVFYLPPQNFYLLKKKTFIIQEINHSDSDQKECINPQEKQKSEKKCLFKAPKLRHYFPLNEYIVPTKLINK